MRQTVAKRIRKDLKTKGIDIKSESGKQIYKAIKDRYKKGLNPLMSR